jgi:hypothetical protein
VSKARIAILVVLLLLAVGLAFMLTGTARDLIIIPLVKFFWFARGIYGSVPEAEAWVGVEIVLALIFGVVLLRAEWGEREVTEKRPIYPGDVQQLSFWIDRGRKGTYSRWHLARRLADLALEILESRGANAKATRQLSGPGWDPPPAVQKYLETALRTTYADFSRNSATASESSLDADVPSVVAYLESLLESDNDH